MINVAMFNPRYSFIYFIKFWITFLILTIFGSPLLNIGISFVGG